MAKNKHHGKAGRARRNRSILAVLFLFIVAIIIGVGTFLATFDINSYRAPLEAAILQQTGRAITLGPIAWSLSLKDGLSIGVSDVSVPNPAWASRVRMAQIGSAKLRLDLMPLLHKKLNIIAFELAKTDVQLESGANGVVNWDFSPPAVASPASKTTDIKDDAKKPTTTAPVSLNIHEVKITDSRFGLKGKEGKLSLFDVPELVFTDNSKGVNLHFKGSTAGVLTEIDLNGGKLDQLSKSNWPFTAQAVYDGLKVDTHGTVNDNMKKIVMEAFTLTAGESDMTGQLVLTLGGPRPSLEGKLHSKHIDLHDFEIKSEEKTDESGAPAAPPQAPPSDKIFTTKPLALDGLKAADAHLALSVDTFVAGLTSAQNLSAKIELENGHLTLAPITAQVAGSKTDAVMKVDASSPTALITANLKSPSLDMSQLFKMGGMESAISGKTEVDIELTTSGRSTHDFAAHSNGKINLLMDSGVVSSSMLREIAGGLVSIFAPGASSLKPGINCLAARYTITNGLMDTKGLLIDTEVTTIAGKGYVNLPDERISMSLFTKPKGLGIGSMIPPMRISGDLTKPSFNLDTAGAVQKLTGLLTNDSTVGDGVPALAAAPAGVNACALTLDNPGAAPTEKRAPLIPGDMGQIKNNVKDLGSKLLKGLGGGLLGN